MENVKTLKPKTGGRQAGTPNKVSWQIRQAAMAHADGALDVLASLLASENEAVRIQAAREILDRACGKTVDAKQVQYFESADERRGKPRQSTAEMLAGLGL